MSREARREYIEKLIHKYGWTQGAEIGCLVGWTHFYLLDQVPELHMYAVDSWKDKSGSCTYPKQIENRAEFYERASNYGDRCTILEMDSLEAAIHVPDESLDFIFIDGDHSYNGCRRDIIHWYQKIKNTGWIIGHDYLQFPGVKQAVDELLFPVNCAAEETDETWARPKILCGSNSVTICCIKWGDKYGPEYVNRLFNMVQRNVHLAAYDFVCFTEDRTGIDPHIRIVPLLCDLEGWWQKIALFKNHLDGIYTDKILFMDLDVVITGSLDPLLEYDADFAICRDWPEEIRPDDERYNSSLFLLKIGSRTEVWKDFRRGIETPAGDQEWIYRAAPDAKLFPYEWTPSYKLRALEKDFPPEARLVIFHGDPKPPDCGGWVRELWK